MMETGIDETTKKKIIGVINAVIPNVRVLLFGSRATGDYRESSDIDIALDGDRRLSRLDVMEIRDMLEASNIPRKIDVLDLHAVDEQMKATILREGIVWQDYRNV